MKSGVDKYVAFENENSVKKAKIVNFRSANSLAKFIYKAFFYKNINFQDGLDLKTKTFFTEKLGKNGSLAFMRLLTDIADEIIHFCDVMDLPS